MLRAYSGRDDLKTATAHANGVHSWRGRMAYELLSAVEYLSHAAILLLAHEDDGYIREKLHKGLNQITGGLYEGVRPDAPLQHGARLGHHRYCWF